MSDYTWVGLDVHAESITAAILEGERDHAEVVTLSGDLMKVRRLFRQLATKGPVRSCYEASGAGFVLHRVLSDDGFHCEVIAPSLIPRKPGDRRKTDRIDAVNLARLYRSGHLTPVANTSRLLKNGLGSAARERVTFLFARRTTIDVSVMVSHPQKRGGLNAFWTFSATC